MADFTALKTAIQNAIKQNGNEEITGNILQDVLLAIVSTLGDGSINDLITALGSEVTTRGNADTTLQQNIDAEAQARGNADTALGGRIDGVIESINAINTAIGNGYVYAGIATPSSTPASGKVFYLALTAGTYTNYGGLEVSQGINILKNNGSTWSLDPFLGIDDAPTPSSNNLVKSGGVFNDIMTNGSAFDLTAYNNGTTYADLNAALTALNALPAAYKKGGMSMKYVQSSDNKYVQARCMAQDFTTDVTQWQGVEICPAINSDNIITSGTTYNYLAKTQNTVNNPTGELGFVHTDGTITSSNDYTIVKAIKLEPGQTILVNKGSSVYIGTGCAVLFKTDSEGNWTETLKSRDSYGGNTNAEVVYTNTTNSDIYVGTCTYTNSRSYIIETLQVAASQTDIENYTYSKVQTNDIAAKIGFTTSYVYNRFIKEIYLNGIISDGTYYLKAASKTDGGSWYFEIWKTGSPQTEVAVGYLSASAEKTSLVRITQINSSGVNGYGIVDWSAIPFGMTNIGISATFYNQLIVDLNYSPTIYAYLKDIDIQATIVSQVENITNLLPKEIFDYDDPTVLKQTTKVKYNGTDAEHINACVVAPIILEPGDEILLNKGKNVTLLNDCSTLFISDSEGNFVSRIEGNNTSDYIYRPISYKNTGIADIYIGTCTTIAQKNYSIKKNVDAASEASVEHINESINERIDNVINDGIVGIGVYPIAQHIKEERSYFLNENYSDEVSYVDTSYLDGKIRNIPAGKHFIFTTDNHIDYYNVGLRQRETEIISYVKAKLNAGCVIFGGDAIGQQDTPYKAAKVLSVYTEDKFNAFGSDFLWCQGNHDANANDGQNQIPSTEIYKRTTGIMGRYGKAVFDTDGIDLINALEATDEQKAKMIAWWKLHYYYDDNRNKIRFITIETGDGSDGLYTLNNGSSWDGYLALNAYITFIGNALLTCPDGWDAVIVLHQIVNETWINSSAVMSFGLRSYYDLYAMLSAFKNKTSVTVVRVGDNEYGNKPFLKSIVESRIPSAGATFNFSNRTSGRCITISGHYHFDDAWIIQNPDTSSVWNYRGKEYGEWDTILNDAILSIQLDRACIYEKGSWTNPENPNHSKAPNAVSFANQDDNAEAGTDGERFGTVKEVLFDVVTITPDNKVVCTRIGAGSDRTYDLPTQS